MADPATDKPSETTTHRRTPTVVSSLSSLVGAHPDALRKIYGAGRPADPALLGDAPRGRVLAFEPGSEVFMLTRPIVRAFASDLFPWRGKVFDHGGNSGRNVVLGKQVFRFHCEVGASEIDGRPTLRLDYAEPAFKNPWPVRAVIDELRMVGDTIALGNALLEVGGRKHLLLWWGLEASSSQ